MDEEPEKLDISELKRAIGNPGTDEYLVQVYLERIEKIRGSKFETK